MTQAAGGSWDAQGGILGTAGEGRVRSPGSSGLACQSSAGLQAVLLLKE